MCTACDHKHYNKDNTLQFVDVDPNLASSEVFAKTGSKLELAQYLGLEKKKN